MSLRLQEATCVRNSTAFSALRGPLGSPSNTVRSKLNTYLKFGVRYQFKPTVQAAALRLESPGTLLGYRLGRARAVRKPDATTYVMRYLAGFGMGGGRGAGSR
jgi:hypothetical protein